MARARIHKEDLVSATEVVLDAMETATAEVDFPVEIDLVPEQGKMRGGSIEYTDVEFLIGGSILAVAGNLYVPSPHSLVRWANIIKAKSPGELPPPQGCRMEWLAELAKKKFPSVFDSTGPTIQEHADAIRTHLEKMARTAPQYMPNQVADALSILKTLEHMLEAMRVM